MFERIMAFMTSGDTMENTALRLPNFSRGKHDEG